MYAKYIRSYMSKKGNKVFVHSVHGTTAELEAFEEAQGEFHRTDEKTGVPLWFPTRFSGRQVDLIITQNGKIVPDTSKFDEADSLAKQYGGNLGQELARAAAANLLGYNAAPTTAATAESQGSSEGASEEGAAEESSAPKGKKRTAGDMK